MNDTNMEPQDFWNNLYKTRIGRSNGEPTAILERFVTGRPPGFALDLGCARGDDVVWLATQGWVAMGVDISTAALDLARANAARAGVAAQTRFEQCDLALEFPTGAFDLVSASFLQTPFEFPRIKVLQMAAGAVRIGGMLLTSAHQRVAPWSRGDPERYLPDGPRSYAELELSPDEWTEVFVGSLERSATGPEGQTAQVIDAVVALERR